ncbi:MAG: glutaredoxin family protein [Acidobacteria bacterium]|nr:glutaredoxin family protein [Acidobacteriota bacterium]MBI3663634.1 glutaredoxin family protein [Acidobacteriota bacterium]
MAKEFLSSRGVDFEERNIRTDSEFIRELVEDHQSRATPTLVAGSQVVTGFDPTDYEAAMRTVRGENRCE